jgi:acetyltransferase-like isoleucine patch superfamily enzyme
MQKKKSNIYPEAKVSDSAEIGDGSKILRCEIGENVKIGKNCVVGNGTLIEDDVVLEDGVKIWHNSHVRNNAKLGKNCVVGDCVFIDSGVQIGNECKFQNGVLIYHGVTVGNGVFFGPNSLTTNDLWPRARKPGGGLRGADDWEVGTITIEDDASIGAGAVLVANDITIGKAAMIGSGAVVIKDVDPYTTVVGNPARNVGDTKDKEDYKNS